MNSRIPDSSRSDLDTLGGRLLLLAPHELSAQQTQLRDEIAETRGVDAAEAGFTMQLPDGRLIGPFNVYLYVPELGRALRQWGAATARHDLPQDVQQAAILTVGVAWRSEYEIYAHQAEARHAGLPAEAIEAILHDEEPTGLSAAALVAHQLARALVVDHAVGDELYRRATEIFGVSDLVALVNVIGRYMNVAALLACFQIPVPVDEHISGQT
jgi:4-carboxymuconolactone decarboxylase